MLWGVLNPDTVTVIAPSPVQSLTDTDRVTDVCCLCLPI